ncbi:GPI mannosyltransferase [Trinorchestia longiramus]|nr:GPI mannosyltransferase [Trinorchestia longiramus]
MHISSCSVSKCELLTSRKEDDLCLEEPVNSVNFINTAETCGNDRTSDINELKSYKAINPIHQTTVPSASAETSDIGLDCYFNETTDNSATQFNSAPNVDREHKRKASDINSGTDKREWKPGFMGPMSSIPSGSKINPDKTSSKAEIPMHAADSSQSVPKDRPPAGRARRRVMFRAVGQTNSGAVAASSQAAAAEFRRKQQWVINARAWDTPVWWCCLAVLRVLLAGFQTSYLHPDEFHQSLQVRARDVLQIEGQKPWEFTTSHPIRSIVFSGLVSLPFSVLRILSPYASYYLDWQVMTPSILLLMPRLFMTFLSFIADFCVYKIARMCYVRPWQCMEVFASSYVMLVYATRTFSNTLELILMCIVLWRVSLSIVESTKVIRRETLIDDLYQSAEEMRHKVRLVRLRSSLPPYNYSDSFLLSVVVTYGIFVRPTFLLYTFIPMAYWLQRGVVTKELNFRYYNLRCLSLLPGIVLTFTLCVLADSFYYESITAKELVRGNITANSFIVTPLNFYAYNKKSENLATHGEHPHFLHLVVNLPLLHGVLAFVGLYHMSLFLSCLFSARSIARKPKVYSLATMLMLSFIVPVMILSFFVHQEARFLLPTLPSLVLLHSDKVSLHNFFQLRFTKHFLFLMWHSWNIFCVVFFGFLHQGGVTNAVISVHDYIESKSESFDVPVHVYFSHMYTPPTFLLMRKIEVFASTLEGRKFRVPRTIYSHHLSGSTGPSQLSSLLHSQLLNNTGVNDSTLPQKKNNTVEVILCLPGSVAADFLDTEKREDTNCAVECDSGGSVSCLSASSHTCGHTIQDAKKLDHLHFELVQRLPMHVSFEHLPSSRLRMSQECDQLCATKRKLLEFSVEIFRVSLRDRLPKNF